MISNAKATIVEEHLWYYMTQSLRDKSVVTFPNDVSPNVNVITRPEFELSHNDFVIQDVIPYVK